MKYLIDKSALVAEIKRRRKIVSDPILSGNDLMIGERNALFNLLSFIDTLEVIEIGVDTGSPEGDIGVKTIWDGDKIVSNKAQKGE